MDKEKFNQAHLISNQIDFIEDKISKLSSMNSDKKSTVSFIQDTKEVQLEGYFDRNVDIECLLMEEFKTKIIQLLSEKLIELQKKFKKL